MRNAFAYIRMEKLRQALLGKSRPYGAPFEQAPSPCKLKRNENFGRPPHACFGCRRKLLNETNHLQPDRRRGFYLAINLRIQIRRLRTYISFADSVQADCVRAAKTLHSACRNGAAIVQSICESERRELAAANPKCVQNYDGRMSQSARFKGSRANSKLHHELPFPKEQGSRLCAEETFVGITATALAGDTSSQLDHISVCFRRR